MEVEQLSPLNDWNALNIVAVGLGPLPTANASKSLLRGLSPQLDLPPLR